MVPEDFEITGLGARLAQARDRMNWTQEDLALEIGSAPATVGAYEGGRSKPSLLRICRIALACKVTLNWLVGLDEE